jgi:hypothetical protein
MRFDTKKPLLILAVLSVTLLFSSISSTQPTVVLLAQFSSESFVGNRAVVKVNNCETEDITIESIQIESDPTHFTVREVGIHDGFGSSEHVFPEQSANRDVNFNLENPTCVSALEVIGYHRADHPKRSTVKIWGLRR